VDEATIDRAAIERLAKALAFVCGADHPTTVALRTAAESGSEGHQERPRAVPEIKAGDRRAALSDARRLSSTGVRPLALPGLGVRL
jgi:hypothetical protein